MEKYIDRNNVDLAKVVLLQIMDRPRSLAEVYAYCKTKAPLKKSEIKAARKELGIVSREENGIWLWSLPDQEVDPD